MWIIHELFQEQSYTGYIKMHQFINALIKNLENTFYEKSAFFDIYVNVDDLHFKTDTAIPLGLILNEWLTNIFKYGKIVGDKGLITLKLAKKDGNYELTIRDNCAQWDWVSTKGNGLGLYLVENLSRQLNIIPIVDRINNHTIITLVF
jgi:two-component sensor histidine kinase